MMQRHNTRLFMAGFLSTFAMTLVLHPLFSARLPNVELATLIGSQLAGMAVAPYSAWWWVGLAEHFFNGSVLFPLLYSISFARIIPGNSIVSGAAWGAFLWLVSQVIVLPLFGYGFFGGAVHESSVVAALGLLIHAIYGLAFGALLGYVPSHRKSGPAHQS